MTNLRKKMIGLTLAGTVALGSLGAGILMNDKEVKAEAKKQDSNPKM